MRRHEFLRATGLVALLSTATCASAQLVTTFAGVGTPVVSPWGVATDASGNVFVAEMEASRIRKIAPDGATSTFFRGFPGYEPEALYPLVLAVDREGTVWAGDQGDGWDGGYLKKIDATGRPFNLFSLWPAVSEPTGVAVGRNGELFVCDSSGGLLRIVDEKVDAHLAPNLNGFCNVAADRAGNVYVSQARRHVVWKVAPDGSVALLAGSGQAGAADGVGLQASFSDPTGLAVDLSGNVYVADHSNHLVRRIAPDGRVSTVAGSGVEGRTDGIGRSASFTGPAGLALDCSGNLYVTEPRSGLVRRIAVPEGSGSPLCGSALVVPSVARVRGARGSFWTSDVVVHNRSDLPTDAQLQFLGNDDDTRGLPKTAIALGPFQSVELPDVLLSAFGVEEGFGALRITAPSGNLTVRSRSWTATGAGSVGDNVPGVPLEAFFGGGSARRPVLAGLRDDGAFRTNLIVVNGATIPITLAVHLYDDGGKLVGEAALSLGPSAMKQVSRVLLLPEFAGARGVTFTAALSSPTPGASYYALATVIDNASNDPTTVLPQ